MSHYWNKTVDIKELEGKVVRGISGLHKGSEEVDIVTECGQHYRFEHIQDCCEHVDLEDFEHDGIEGANIISAVESTSYDDPNPRGWDESYTWTFYRINTTKGELFMRWLGESNGYYSESVDLIHVNKEGD